VFYLTIAAVSFFVVRTIFFVPYTETVSPPDRGNAAYETTVQIHKVTSDKSSTLITLSNSLGFAQTVDSPDVIKNALGEITQEKYLAPKLLWGFYEDERQLVTIQVISPPAIPAVGTSAFLEVFSDRCAYLTFQGEATERADHKYTVCNATCGCELKTETESKGAHDPLVNIAADLLSSILKK
jgi:hypothetical protein